MSEGESEKSPERLSFTVLSAALWSDARERSKAVKSCALWRRPYGPGCPGPRSGLRR
jgi:hypothetical protein